MEDGLLTKNFLSIEGISIKDGETVYAEMDDGSLRKGFYDRVLGAIVWCDDFTKSPTDHMMMIRIERWLNR